MNIMGLVKQNRPILWWVLLVMGVAIVMIYFYQPWDSGEEGGLQNPSPAYVAEFSSQLDANTTGYVPRQTVIPADQNAENSQLLFERLPFNGQGFRIIFDFKENKFIVYPVPVDNDGYKQQFLEWLKNSEYSAIPLSSFGF